jgi:uncharacterized membrane protein HdeD (DUF308 family)
MLRHDSEKKRAKRRITFCRLFVGGAGVASICVAVFGLLVPTPITGVMIVAGLIGLVLVCSGVLSSDKVCERIADAISRDDGC